MNTIRLAGLLRIVGITFWGVTATFSQDTQTAPGSSPSAAIISQSSSSSDSSQKSFLTSRERLLQAGELNLAASNFNLSKVEKLLASGVDPNGVDELHVSAIQYILKHLWRAQGSNAAEMLQLLVKGGADINLPAYRAGMTPYLESMEVQDLTAMDLLVHLQGADCDLLPLTTSGCSPLSYSNDGSLALYRKHLEERWQKLSEADRDRERARLRELFQKTHIFHQGRSSDPDVLLTFTENGRMGLVKNSIYSDAVRNEYTQLYQMASPESPDLVRTSDREPSTTTSQVVAKSDTSDNAFLKILISMGIIGLLGMVGYLKNRVELGKELFPWRRVYIGGLIMLGLFVVELALGLMLCNGFGPALITMMTLVIIVHLTIVMWRYHRCYSSTGISSPLQRAILSSMATLGMALVNLAIIPIVLGVIAIIIGASYNRTRRAVVLEDDLSPPRFFS